MKPQDEAEERNGSKVTKIINPSQVKLESTKRKHGPSKVTKTDERNDTKRMRFGMDKKSSGRHGMFRSTVLMKFKDVMKNTSKSAVSAAGVGEDELHQQASMFMNVLDSAFDMAEQNITDRVKNPLFWNLRDAFILKDIKGLTNEIQYSFQSFLIRQRFSKGLEESHKRLLDFRFPYEWFPATRAMQRTIHVHVGPTNSGKTYRALKALENSKRGVYAGPLRLLANEVYQRLTAKGLPCALLTGEEVRLPEDTDTYFTSCTVEMVPFNDRFDVAVIDEIQMLADPDRGNAWTTALLGVQAKEVHLCGEERTQAALFNDPDNDYDFIVASDAIGMGLNLEIRRVILEAVAKFDGSHNRMLTYPELKQIGGRAGRYRTVRNAAEAGTNADVAVEEETKVGYVTTMDTQDLRSVHRAFGAKVDDIEAAYISPPAAAIERFSTYFPKGTPLSFILMRIRELASVSKQYRIHISPDKLEIADHIQDIPLTIYDRLLFTNLPINARAQNAVPVLRALARIVANSEDGGLLKIKEIPLENLEIDFKTFKGTSMEYLHRLESLHAAINQYIWLSYRFSGLFRDQKLAFHVRSLVEEKLIDTLERLDFTESDLKGFRSRNRMEARKTTTSREELGETDLKNLEQESDDTPIGDELDWKAAAPTSG
ncbi:ATP-dependent RNA helicase suv3, mitochondrial [Fusarium odoratissimum]|uniref:RNA helicase n=1 Tax=Fusarium oxysporum f. sp. cubense (strain race 4) TaxID=2502994 RepID=N1RWT7_FUSC4|nr:ATP-dependent RNA helicase suv3, mitochondrial [Fusarium odoratissimum]